MIADDRICHLGEGPLWHPERGQLFWFDILGKRLLTKGREWSFPVHVSAAGWIDHDTLMIASESGLHRFDISSGKTDLICPLEADNPLSRSNDGRGDPQGGFWIGTMGIHAPRKPGAIYRYYRGELRQLICGLVIPNSICFSPDGTRAYFSDTVQQQIMTVGLDDHGWPKGDPSLHIDLRAEGRNPDGAVVDASGNLWNAQWGSARVACYDPQGRFLHTVPMGASQSSCPAFGGPDLKTLYCTTAVEGLSDGNPDNGKLMMVETDYTGQPEHRVHL